MCSFCEMLSTGTGKERYANGNLIAIRFGHKPRLAVNLKGVYADFDVSFCPMCGRDLAELGQMPTICSKILTSEPHTVRGKVVLDVESIFYDAYSSLETLLHCIVEDLSNTEVYDIHAADVMEL